MYWESQEEVQGRDTHLGIVCVGVEFKAMGLDEIT